jgi:hypothetical protein
MLEPRTRSFKDNGYDQVQLFQSRNGIAIATLTGSRRRQVPTLVDPSRLPRLGTIDERFQSYNVEMVEVTAETSGNLTGQAPQRRRPATR